MEKFKTFLSEAKVSERSFEKAVSIFKKLLERKLATRFYRYGGPNGFCYFGKNKSILYIYDRDKAISFNYKSGSIDSVFLWKTYKLGKINDYTIDLGGVGLTGAGKKLIDLIHSPVIGKYEIYPELIESNIYFNEKEVLSEAKRVSVADFYSLAMEYLRVSSEEMGSLRWEQIEAVAKTKDVGIPTPIRKDARYKVSRGQYKYDLNKILGDKGSDKPAQVDKTYYIKVTAQNNSTKKFETVKGDKYAENILGQVQNSLNNPGPKDFKKEMKDPDTMFGHMSDLVKVVALGGRNALLIYGSGGMGKTYVTLETLKGMGLTKGSGYNIIKGKVTTASLYKTLFMYRNGDLLIFDDADSIWGDKDAANILKAALDNYDEREISWYSNLTQNISKLPDEDKEDYYRKVDDEIASGEQQKLKYPASFPYTGKIIFISNLPYEKFDNAVMTRAAKIDMTLTQDQIFQRMLSILDNVGDKSVPRDAKEMILDKLKAKNASGVLNGVSMRTYVAAEDLYKTGLPNWEDLIEYV